MRDRRSVALRRCLSQAFGSASTFVAFDALATPVPTACGDFLFFNSKKKEAKNADLRRREACTAQIALRVAQHALACEGSCKMDVGCEMDLRAVRDRFLRWYFARAYLTYCVTARKSFAGRISHHIRSTENQFSIIRSAHCRLRLCLRGKMPLNTWRTLTQGDLNNLNLDR